jgi:hypothetical protein
MAKSVAVARGSSVFRSLIAVLAASAFPLDEAAAIGPDWPTEFTASYNLSFAGIDVGTYQFNAHFNNGGYEATSKAQVSAFFGAFKWVGNFSGKGGADPSGLRPEAFEMSYKKKKKFVSVKIGFAGPGRTVSSVALIPNRVPSPDTVKLKPENLKNVFDPMSAMISVSDATPANACNRVIPVFDGKERYDLHFSFKAREPLTERHPSGQPKELIVCRVKYIPIAGHKRKDFADPWIDYNNIEFALRAVPKAGIYVPYRITIPSPIGSAVMTADTINITAANNQQIAMKQ